MRPVPMPKVLCFGEVLWDCLPDGRQVGGAPLNVAYHLSRLGSSAWPISSVGDDSSGREMLEQVQRWELSCELICTQSNKQTGRVDISLDQGVPTFDVVEDVAWDYIELPETLPDSCQPVDAIVYGSLAQRSTHNRAILQRILEDAPGALKVFDVNLRPPFDTPENLWALARSSDLLKLNDEEAVVLLEQKPPAGDVETSARALQQKTGCKRICITAGSAGGGLLDHDAWHWADAIPVQVCDTVGAGDAFLAALLHGLLVAPEQPMKALQTAAILASFVAGSDGATPHYSIHDLF